MVVALIHSPLASPFSWAATAEALRRRGYTVPVPELRDAPGGGPYWRQHAHSAVEGLHSVPTKSPLVLAAHSGAGALLPAIGQALGRPVAGYLFVDAVMPSSGRSRLEGFGTPKEIAAFRAYLEGGGLFPSWTADDLREVVPDAAARARLVAELRPRGLDYWTEHIPAAAGWPDAPGSYLRFTETYRSDAERARALGWPVREMAGGHFQMMVAPEVVAEAMEAAVREWTTGDGRLTTDDILTKDERRRTTNDKEVAMMLSVGQTASRSLTLTEGHVRTYAELTGDYNPLHFDEAFAAGTRFGRRVVQGGLTTGLLHALVAMDLPGPGTVFLSQNWKFTAPVYIGDTITAEAVVMSVHPSKPVTQLTVTVRRGEGEVVLAGEAWCYTMRVEAGVKAEGG